MDKHKKINIDQINNIIDDEKDKFSNKMYFDESETKSCIDNENKTKQFVKKILFFLILKFYNRLIS